MKNKLLYQNIVFTVIAFSPLFTMLFLWDSIPDMIPYRQQYGFHDDGVGLSAKTNLWGSIPVITGVTLLVYYLMIYIKRVDPKRAGKTDGSSFGKFAVGMVLLLTALNFIMLFDNIGRIKNAQQIMMPMMGVLFAFLGNVMHNVKPNYFVGIRIPWTLNSDYNWKKTHQLAGKLWFAMGLLFSISYLLFPHLWNDTNFLLFILILVAVPVGYSFMLHRKENPEPNN